MLEVGDLAYDTSTQETVRIIEHAVGNVQFFAHFDSRIASR